jgi:hypothetical protein
LEWAWFVQENYKNTEKKQESGIQNEI